MLFKMYIFRYFLYYLYISALSVHMFLPVGWKIYSCLIHLVWIIWVPWFGPDY